MNKFSEFRKVLPGLLDSPSKFSKDDIDKIYRHFKVVIYCLYSI